MSLKIRLTRMGSHKKPFYRVVVAQSSSPRDGKYVAKLGTYNPFLEENKFKLDINDVKDWIKKGAQPTKIIQSFINRFSDVSEKDSQSVKKNKNTKEKIQENQI